MTDYIALHTAWRADPSDRTTALALADWLEEFAGRQQFGSSLGSLDMAFALRWCAARKRWPARSPKGKSVTWTTLAHRQRKDYPHQLPRAVWGAIRPKPRELLARWRSLDAAYRALASALRVLRDAVALEGA
jgi:hypothetical protein